MFLVIQYKKEEMLVNNEGMLILNLPFHTDFSNAVFLITGDSHTDVKKLVENNSLFSMRILKRADLMIGKKGGFTLAK